MKSSNKSDGSQFASNFKDSKILIHIRENGAQNNSILFKLELVYHLLKINNICLNFSGKLFALILLLFSIPIISLQE
jgi:hypothetical protein